MSTRDEKAEAACPPQIMSGILIRAATDANDGERASSASWEAWGRPNSDQGLRRSGYKEAQEALHNADANLRREQEKQTRDAIRCKLLEKVEESHAELVERVGPAMTAFRILDLSRSGRISSNEFADGVTRLGIDWQNIIGSKSGHHLFSLFASGRGIIDLPTLFPGHVTTVDPARLDTPEFWEYYNNKTKDVGEMKRGPRYEAALNQGSVDERIEIFNSIHLQNDEAARTKGWMSATMRRLKSKGKGDARCRELVALHLPKGTGPYDMEKVPIFSANDAKGCKKKYTDKMNEPVHNMQKHFIDMKEQRRVLSLTRQKLNTAIEPGMRSSLAADFAGFGAFDKATFGLGDFGKSKESAEDADASSSVRQESKPRRSSFCVGA